MTEDIKLIGAFPAKDPADDSMVLVVEVTKRRWLGLGPMHTLKHAYIGRGLMWEEFYSSVEPHYSRAGALFDFWQLHKAKP